MESARDAVRSGYGIAMLPTPFTREQNTDVELTVLADLPCPQFPAIGLWSQHSGLRPAAKALLELLRTEGSALVQ